VKPVLSQGKNVQGIEGNAPRKRDEKLTGGCRKLHIEELQNLYSFPNNVRLIESSRI
jgi:hypothetical protein